MGRKQLNRTPERREAKRLAVSGKNNINYGKKMTLKQRKQLSDFRKSFTGWKHSPETRAKITAANRARAKFNRERIS
jgi:hypothetical protein